MSRPPLRVEPLEVRLTPAWVGPLPDGAVLVPAAQPGWYRIIDPDDGTDVGTIQPFGDGFAGEAHAAVGDVTGDHVPDLVVAAGGGGGPRVRVYDGATGVVVADFLAYESDFRGGVYVAAADLDADGTADVVCGAGEGGGSRVRVFRGGAWQPLLDYLAFEPDFRGGVRVAAGDVDGDGIQELIAGAGPGGAPRVSVIRPFPSPPIRTPTLGISPTLPPREVLSFFAYDPALRGGVSVATTGAGTSFAAASLTIGAEAKVVTAPGAGGGPVVKVFSGTTGQEYFAYLRGDEASRTGLAVAASRDVVVGVTPTPAGPSLVAGPWTTGQTYWTLPPGYSRVVGTVSAVDAAGPTVTLLTARSGLAQLRVRADATIRVFANPPIALRDVPVGSNATAEALLAPDGQVVDLHVTVLIPPPRIV